MQHDLTTATAVLRRVAEEFCLADGRVLHSGGSVALMAVIEFLRVAGEAERYEHRESFTGQNMVDYMCVRLKPNTPAPTDTAPHP